MGDQWTFTGESVALGRPGNVTLVEGSAFCISEGSGDIVPGAAEGFFFIDTRLLSRLTVQLNGYIPEPLAVDSAEHFSATFVGRTRPEPGLADSSLMVFRTRYVGHGMTEEVRIRNFSDDPASCQLQIGIDVDLADLFAVKEGRAAPRRNKRLTQAAGRSIVFQHRRGPLTRGARVSFDCDITGMVVGTPSVQTVTFDVVVPPRGDWATCLEVEPQINDEILQPSHRCGGAVELEEPRRRLAKWRRETPIVSTDWEPLRRVVGSSISDLGALRMFDPESPELPVVAAGLPWFMTLFGRDSILTSWMALIAEPDLALGVLQTLARFQGKEVNPATEEQPGRILHEIRFGDSTSMTLDSGHAYYGTADATPLFVMLLGELRRWGLATETVDRLLPHADRALEWVEKFGDSDGDGYVEYQRSTEHGLANQGWKDSWDGVRFADGTLPEAPIAMAEIQGYVYGAYLARHYFALEASDAEGAVYWRDKAFALKEAFNRDFWLEDRGWYAMALDRDKRPVDALASNMGHCLWTGIVDTDKAERVADRLVGPEMFTGWGIRTLGSSMRGYNPIGYHTGSVWPHDNAIIAAGLMRYGLADHARRVATAIVEAAASQGGRLPELFSGLDRTDFPQVVSYPASCLPQAWAAASPLSLLRTLLRFDPWVPHGKIWLDPVLPEDVDRLEVQRIALAGSRVTVRVENGKVSIDGLPESLHCIKGPRDPLTAVL